VSIYFNVCKTIKKQTILCNNKKIKTQQIK
jgi:hypothetical protein